MVRLDVVCRATASEHDRAGGRANAGPALNCTYLLAGTLKGTGTHPYGPSRPGTKMRLPHAGSTCQARLTTDSQPDSDLVASSCRSAVIRESN